MEFVEGVATIWLMVAAAEAIAAIIRGLKPVETKAQFEARWIRERDARREAFIANHIAEERKAARRIARENYRADQVLAANRIKAAVKAWFE